MQNEKLVRLHDPNILIEGLEPSSAVSLQNLAVDPLNWTGDRSRVDGPTWSDGVDWPR